MEGLKGDKLKGMLERERAAWLKHRPKSREIFERAQRSQVHGTPHHYTHGYMPAVPVIIASAEAATLHDVDGHTYADFGMGGMCALWGHSNPAVMAALKDRLDHGIATSWMNEDHVVVTEELRRRFPLPYWQFAVTSTDANRYSIRLARVATKRRRVLVFNQAFHGTVDDTNAVLDGTNVVPTPGIDPNGLDLKETTAVANFNDLEGAERALKTGTIAAVMVEAVMTNRGNIIQPDPGFHSALREMTRRAGAILIVDETHTITAGMGGCTRLFSLEPDMITIGKSIAGGVPGSVFGMTEDMARVAAKYTATNDAGMGNALSGCALAARGMRAVLTKVMTEANYALMHSKGERYREAATAVFAKNRLPWHMARLGARVNYAFTPQAVRDLSGHKHGFGRGVREAVWLYLANRGVITHGRNGAAIFSPMTDDRSVEKLVTGFGDAIAELTH